MADAGEAAVTPDIVKAKLLAEFAPTHCVVTDTSANKCGQAFDVRWRAARFAGPVLGLCRCAAAPPAAAAASADQPRCRLAPGSAGTDRER